MSDCLFSLVYYLVLLLVFSRFLSWETHSVVIIKKMHSLAFDFLMILVDKEGYLIDATSVYMHDCKLSRSQYQSGRILDCSFACLLS